jgi:hypothetical protein
MTTSAERPAWILEKGGEARLLETDGDHVTLESTRAFPPGSPLVARAEGTGETYRIKVRGSQRTGDGVFRVEGRFVNLSRPARDRLLTEARAPKLEASERE